MELVNIILSEASRLRRPKATFSFSNVEYRPNTNAAIWGNTGHTKWGGGHTWMGQEINLNSVEQYTLSRRMNIELLIRLKLPKERD
jgi:hypothetical protein